MSSRGWLNLESASSALPDNQLFEGEPAFSFLGLTRTQRLYGFVGCIAVGFILSILGTVFLLIGFLGTFALLYSIGLIVSIIASGFLIGFFKQVKQMFKPVRVAATLVFIASIGLVFVGAFVIGNGIMCLVFAFIEYLAYTWYCLSYIPYARTAVLKTVGFST